MKPRWKGVVIAVVIAGAASLAFSYLFYGLNLDDGMAVQRITRKGVVWIGVFGESDHRKHHEPLAHFLGGAAALTAVSWLIASCLLGPAGWVAGYLWERRRKATPDRESA
jgi:hypothetical protein